MPPLSPTAMILAAGLGTRMRPLTLTKPKPLHPVGGRTMLDHAIDKLIGAGITRVVVNTHYLAEQIETHLHSRKDIDIIISREEALLDTGGGVAKALPYFEGKPFFALNADLPWIDGKIPSLQRMRDMWDAEKMDVMLLVKRADKTRGVDPTKGDFSMDTNNRLQRQNKSILRPYVMIAAQILSPALFAAPPAAVFSNNLIWNIAESRDRLYGIEHDGACYHVGTPQDLERANALLASGAGWDM